MALGSWGGVGGTGPLGWGRSHPDLGSGVGPTLTLVAPERIQWGT